MSSWGWGPSLSRSKEARRDRAETALRRAGFHPLPQFETQQLGQASAQEVTLHPCGSRLLVSYTTVVGFRDSLGNVLLAPHGRYSRTTDETQRSWLAGTETEPETLWAEAVRKAGL